MLLLFVALVVTAGLAYQGHAADSENQRAVQTFLRNYAATAAAQYAKESQQAIFSLSVLAFHEYGPDAPLKFDASAFNPVEFHELFAKECRCDPNAFVRYHFAYDYKTGTLITPGATLSERQRGRLVDAVTHTSTFGTWGGWNGALAPIGGGDYAWFDVRPLPDDATPSYALGFVSKREMLPTLFPSIEVFNLGLPVDSTTKKSPNVFHIEVVSNDGVEKSGGGERSEYASSWPLDAAFGGFVVRAAVDMTVAAAGGAMVMPRSRTGLLIALSFSLVALIAAAWVMMKRQSELAQARGDFVSSVSHELRTPLAQIRMFAETLLLGRTRNEAERRRSLEIIDQEARRLSALVDNVLQLGRGERNAVRLSPAATALAPAIRDVVESFKQMPRSRSVEFRTELEERLIATVDPGALRQILLNLLDNAVKYGPQAQRVNVGLAMFEEHARLWVDDEGPGISIRERERVFEPFHRSPTQMETRVAGSGIGLAVVRELANLLNGRVWAETAPGGGARIVVEFPEAYLRAEEATGGWAVA